MKKFCLVVNVSVEEDRVERKRKVGREVRRKREKDVGLTGGLVGR
jgi:hypothetical protein